MSLITVTASPIRCSAATASSTCSTLPWAWRWLPCMASTTSRVPCCRPSITPRICSTESWVRRARLRTSSATTAKPRPASPARAASMAALSASRLVCSAMARITSSTEPISSLLLASCSTWPMALVRLAARLSMLCVVRSISARPSRVAWSAPRAASAAWAALRATSWAVAVISWDAVATWSISRNCCCMPALVWLEIAADWSAVLRASRTETFTSRMIGCSLSRKRLNQPASSPSSSRPVCGRRWVRSPSPLAMSRSMWATPRIGRVTPRALSHSTSRPSTAAPRPRPSSTQVPSRRMSSSCRSSARAGPSRALFGTSRSTPQGLAPGIGCNGCSTLRSSFSLNNRLLPAASSCRSSPACCGSALARFLPSRPASRLLPANSPAGLRMPTWPTPS